MERKKYQISLIGKSCSGKTTWIRKNKCEEIEEKYKASQSAVYTEMSIYFDRRRIKVEIWDTPGQEIFERIVPIYYRRSDIICIFVDLSKEIEVNKDIIKYIEKIKEDIENKKMEEGNIIIVGNKKDKEIEGNSIVIKEIANKRRIKYIETSNIDNKYFKTMTDILFYSIIEEENENVIKEIKEIKEEKKEKKEKKCNIN
ncbi:GTP-binding protein YPT6, putative [Entamoeba dispar SAW760]|uniref:GTP-binding protein YPT6, putative n=1 Tax=Entamoeba dispar (strain ATCC PRA-260 / SAW760) TaxID=370354 RepID=B0EHR2_ENTDS|nr:GTP-binding protein YPT6, putative [Entamoeba dispar SAW760]EDR25856.1 GTP-binding protein YPT6, putative [Entamoeba dispar SAW760]|eukprot:EDR25856.1 GTP-binding protein YPT6, putative [Entamoeba dispar SAW760]